MSRLIVMVYTAITLLAAGCVTVPMASMEEDARGKQFVANPDKSLIYLFRNESYGGAVSLGVALDDKMQGNTAPYTYYVWEVSPGRHKITSYGETRIENHVLTTMPNQIYFVRQEVVWRANSSLYEITAEEGKKAVLECNRAQEVIQ